VCIVHCVKVYCIKQVAYATCLIQYTFTQCTIHTPYRISPILYLFYTICFLLVWIFIHILHITYPLLQSQHAAIALTTPCTSFTQILLTKRVIFSQALTLAPWRWFLCKPKHVGAFLSNLECFNNSAFFNVVCISWKWRRVHEVYMVK